MVDEVSSARSELVRKLVCGHSRVLIIRPSQVARTFQMPFSGAHL